MDEGRSYSKKVLHTQADATNNQNDSLVHGTSNRTSVKKSRKANHFLLSHTKSNSSSNNGLKKASSMSLTTNMQPQRSSVGSHESKKESKENIKDVMKTDGLHNEFDRVTGGLRRT